MKNLNFSAILGAAALTLVAVNPAQATPSWQYAFDRFDDGYRGGTFGTNSPYEFYGMAVAEEGDSIFLALNANLNINGQTLDSASGGVVDWGDIFLNFSGKDYDTAIADGDMYGIHFGGDTDSGVSVNGLYSVSTAKNVAGSNSGFTTLQKHTNKKNREGVGNVDYANYFDANASLKNVILDGDKIGDIAFLDETQLASQGLNFTAENAGSIGTQTFGFSFSKTDLNLPPEFEGNDLIATIFAECNNDGIGIQAEVAAFPESPVDPESVPEPASVLGLMAIAGSAFGLRRRRA